MFTVFYFSIFVFFSGADGTARTEIEAMGSMRRIYHFLDYCRGMPLSLHPFSEKDGNLHIFVFFIFALDFAMFDFPVFDVSFFVVFPVPTTPQRDRFGGSSAMRFLIFAEACLKVSILFTKTMETWRLSLFIILFFF